jgi:hydrogenase maturation protein HypF
MSIERMKLTIQGAVQGIGFRPFIYRLAADLALRGYVLNDSRGVTVEVEGPRPDLVRFLERLPTEKPPLAIIHLLTPEWLPPAGYQQFEIRHSSEQGNKITLMLPDIATCDACLSEVLDPANRRYRYPFTNCTNCGPRFSIIQALPYDRPNTTMRHFPMCPDCQGEYDDPSNRRFHAQPNACPRCGPRLWLEDATSAKSAKIKGETDDALPQVAAALRAGQLVALKGVGGFHLLADARSSTAIARLRERKSRPDKPFAFMVRDMQQAHTLCHISPPEEALLCSPEAPIVLMQCREGAPVAPNVAPNTTLLGVMLPHSPLHHMLLREVGFPLVATSGNLRDEPVCTDNQEAKERLGQIADLFVLHDRPIARHGDDSIARVVGGTPQLARRARGYAPLPVLLPGALPPLLAVGAHLKNTIALSVPRQDGQTSPPHTPVFLSQHIGDLETPEALAAFERVAADFMRMYDVFPVAIAHDLHPDYRSTRQASEMVQQAGWEGVPLIAVQHHHAHLAACLAEHGVDSVEGVALGVTWDGSGYGTDGTVWGGEFLRGSAASYTRTAHLRPFHLPGGDAAVREPCRVALALLWELYGEKVLEWDDLAPLRDLTSREQRLLAQMMYQNLNAPITTSAGRLFDGVAALIGLRQRVTFEGQAAVELEHIADPACKAAYPLLLTRQRASMVLDWQPMVEALLYDVRHAVSHAIMAARFHNTLVEGIMMVAQAVGEKRVALTGGCFQNLLLTERTAQHLQRAGFEVLLHRQVPPNDGGISLGQVAVAAAALGKEAEMKQTGSTV